MKQLLGIIALLRVLLAGPQRPLSQRRPLAHWRWPTPECPVPRGAMPWDVLPF